MALLERIGLKRPEHRAWAIYDLANSAFVTIIITALFPIYYSKVCNSATTDELRTLATARLAWTTSIALTLVAIAAPILGAIADTAPVKKKFLGSFMAVGVGATLCMWFLGPGQWLAASILFGIGNFACMATFVFYDSLLPHIARDDEVDRVSTAGYALGYVGGGLLLIVCIVLVKKPDLVGLPNSEVATRVCFVLTAIWWLFFAIPLFRKVPEPPVVLAPKRDGSVLAKSFSNLANTFRELKRYRQAAMFLLAFLIYNDGIGTIIKFAVIYGEELQLDSGALILAIIMVQFVGIPFTFAFGQLASRLTAKRSIYIGLAVYVGVAVLAFYMSSEIHFFALAILVGMVQGGVQALSRSLFASMIPRSKSSEFFGLFAVFEKFAGLFGPLLFALVGSTFGSSRPAILAIIAFFVVGAVLLARVDVTKGQEQARRANAE